MAAQTQFLKKYPNTILALAAAQLEAQQVMIKEQDKAAAKWAEFAQVDLAKAKIAVAGAAPQLHASMRCTVQGFAFSQKVLSIVTPSALLADPAKACDTSFLEKLEAIGFYKKIGAPTS